VSARSCDARSLTIRTVNPVTGASWESVGVQRDLPAAAADALEVARRAALATIADDATVPDASRTEARLLLDSRSAEA
jgi:hypothetical protein